MKKNNIKKVHGGSRPGAGRKPAPYKTKTLAFRVKVEWEQYIRQLVKAELYKLQTPTVKTAGETPNLHYETYAMLE
jgi:hypothetical protein